MTGAEARMEVMLSSPESRSRATAKRANVGKAALSATCRDKTVAMTTGGRSQMSMIIVRAVVDALRHLGLSDRLDDELLRDVSAWNGDPHASLPLERVLPQLLRMQDVHADLGLQIGMRMTGMSFHFLGLLLETRMTLRDCLQTFCEVKRSVLGGLTWRLHEQGDRASFGFVAGTGDAVRLGAEMSVTAFHRNLSHALGDSAGEVWALFQHVPPSYAARYSEVFGGRVMFGTECNGVEFPAALLDRTRTGASEELASAVRVMSEQWLARPANWSERVRRELATMGDLSKLNLTVFAKRFAMSPRSLRRKLEQEGSQLSALVDQARAARARTLVLGGAHSLAEITSELGYHEVNSFARAFKRWFGVSPTRFRLSASDGKLATTELAGNQQGR